MGEGKKTVNAILSVITLTLASKFLGFFRDALLGSKLGATVEADAYIMALNSTTIIFLSFGSAISTSAIPLIVRRLKQGGKDSVVDFTNKLLNMILIIASIVIVIGIIFTPQFLSILAKGFDGDKMNLVIILTKIMFPSLIFISAAYLFVALLQSMGIFVIPAIISFPFNILLILYLLFALKDYGIVGLAYATVIGWSLQLLLQIPFAIKEGYRYEFKLGFDDKDVKRFLLSLLPIIFVASVHQINILVDNMFASTLEHGKVSAIYYANILYTAIVTTTVFGISAVMFPKFSENISPEGINKFKTLVISVLRTVMYLLIPMTIGLIFLNKSVISLVFERGQFNSITTFNTSEALGSYAIGMVGFGVIDILNKAFYTLNNIRIPVIISFIVVITNYVISKILLVYLGFRGLALGTSISLIMGGFILFYIFRKKVGGLSLFNLLKSLMKISFASLVMGITIHFTQVYLNNILLFDGFLLKLAIIIINVILGVLAYGIVTLILKEETSIYIYNSYIKSKLHPKNK